MARPWIMPGWPVLILGVLSVLAFALRVYRLGAQSVWWDEAYSLELAAKSLVDMTAATAVDIHPPLYYAILHFWVALTGTGEFAGRFLSLTFSVALVPLTYQVGRRMLGVPIGLLAAFFMAVSPFHVPYGQEMRMYSLETLLSLGAVYVLLMLLQQAPSSDGEGRRRARPWWVIYAALNLASLYTDYFPAVLFPFHAVAVLMWAASRRHQGRGAWMPTAIRWAVAMAVTGLGYVPWLLIATRQITSYGVGITAAPPVPSLLLHLWSSYNFGLSVHLGDWIAQLWFTSTDYVIFGRVLPFLFGLLIAVIVGSGVVLRRHRPQTGLMMPTHVEGLLAIAFFVVPVAAFVIVMQLRPFYHPRYMLVGVPAYFVLLSMVVYGFWHRWRRLAVILLCEILTFWSMALGNYYFDQEFQKDDTRSAVAFIESIARPNDLVLWETPHPFEYYYHGTATATAIKTRPGATPADITQLAHGKERVFWVTWVHARTDPWLLVPYLLEKHGRKEGERSFTGYKVVWYRIPPDTTFDVGAMDDVSVAFGDQVLLTRVGFGSTEAPSGTVRPWIATRWQGIQPYRKDLKMYVHLRDADGYLVGQYDWFLVNNDGVKSSAWGVNHDALVVAVPSLTPGTPPGTYTIEIGAYFDGDERRLGTKEGRPFTVGTVQVGRQVPPPAEGELPIQWRRPADFNGLQLLGYSMGSDAQVDGLPAVELRPGESVGLALFWRAAVRPAQDRQERLMLVREGGTRTAFAGNPVRGRYPTSQWAEGEVVLDHPPVVLPPDLPAGTYTLTLAMDSGSPVPLAHLRVQELPRSYDLPAIQHVWEQQLGTAVQLLGYDVAGGRGQGSRGTPNNPEAIAEIRGGDALQLSLYWRALGVMERRYTVFTHIEGNGTVLAQLDGQPVRGTMPTTAWLPSQVVKDDYELRLPPGAPSGLYRLVIGMYDGETGQRLPVQTGGDSVFLGWVQVTSR